MSMGWTVDLGFQLPSVGEAANLHIYPHRQPQWTHRIRDPSFGSTEQTKAFVLLTSHTSTAIPDTQRQVEIAKELGRVTMFEASTLIAKRFGLCLGERVLYRVCFISIWLVCYLIKHFYLATLYIGHTLDLFPGGK